MSDLPIFLVEMTYLDQNGSSQVLRVATAPDFMTKPSEAPPNAVYEPRLTTAGSYERHAWQSGSTRGTSQIGFGVVSLANSDGALDWMLTAGIDGQSIVIRRGHAGGSYPDDFLPYFTGVMRRAAPNWNTVDVYITDLLGDVGQKSYQAVKFAGTNSGASGVEGLPTDLMGKPKPKLRGAARNFTPPCVNDALLIYQIDDGSAVLPLTLSGGSGPTALGVFDRRSPLTYSGSVASVAAMQAATVSPSTFIGYAGSDGWYIRLGSTPTKLTVSASEGAITDRTVAQIVNRILVNEGNIPSSQILGVAALDARASQEVGIWVGDETTLQPLIDSILDSVNGFLTDTRDGRFLLGQLTDPETMPSVANIEPWMIKRLDGLTIQPANDPGVGILLSAGVNGAQDRYINNQDATAGLPIWRVKLQYDRNFTVMQGTDVSGAAQDDINYAHLEYRTVALIEGQTQDSSILEVHKNAPEFTVTTLLCNQADAQAEGARQLSLRNKPRYIVQLPVDPFSPLDPTNPLTTLSNIDISKAITLTMPRFGWDTGKKFFVLGMVDDHGDATNPATATLYLWG